MRFRPSLQGDPGQILKIKHVQKRVELAGCLCRLVSIQFMSESKKRASKHTVIPRLDGCRMPLKVGANWGANVGANGGHGVRVGILG